jgi:hypothetical protein
MKKTISQAILRLRKWARDVRHWAGTLLASEPDVCQELFHEAGEKAVGQTRSFYRQHLGSHPDHVD